MNEIEKTRKELEEQIDLNTNLILTHARSEHKELFCQRCKNLANINNIPRAKLEGFNLGVSLAQKDFLDYLIYVYKDYNLGGSMQKEIGNKIDELKQSLGEKGK